MSGKRVPVRQVLTAVLAVFVAQLVVTSVAVGADAAEGQLGYVQEDPRTTGVSAAAVEEITGVFYYKVRVKVTYQQAIEKPRVFTQQVLAYEYDAETGENRPVLKDKIVETQETVFVPKEKEIVELRSVTITISKKQVNEAIRNHFDSPVFLPGQNPTLFLKPQQPASQPDKDGPALSPDKGDPELRSAPTESAAPASTTHKISQPSNLANARGLRRLPLVPVSSSRKNVPRIHPVNTSGSHAVNH